MRYVFIGFWLSLAPCFAYHFQCISHSPRVGIYHQFISQEEALHLIALGRTRLTPSTVVNPEGSGSLYNPGRSSYTAFLEKSEDAIVKGIEERVAGLLGCKLSQIEPLQIVRYQFGQEYKPHHDYFSPEQLKTQNGNQRQHTLLIYLNTLPLEAGGYTVFPRLFIACLPSEGAALYFQNVRDGTHAIEEDTLHAGAPILVSGVEKWACNVWVRQQPWVQQDSESLVALEPAKIPHM